MTKKVSGDDKPLPAHFVIYDYDNPSPLFSEDDVTYIESVRQDFDGEDLARIHAIEEWILNLNTGWLNSSGMPGLRPRPDRGHIYVKRFSNERFQEMISRFLDDVPDDFPVEGIDNCMMRLFRVTLPNGDRFYPITFHGVALDHWPRRLHQAAAHFGTELGHFDHGRFAVSNGTTYPFSALSVDKAARIPKGW